MYKAQYECCINTSCVHAQLMKDEYEALQITCTAVEGKAKQLQKENDQLVSTFTYA